MLLALFSGEMTASGEMTWGYKSLVIFQGTPVQLSAPILGGLTTTGSLPPTGLDRQLRSHMHMPHPPIHMNKNKSFKKG